MNFLATSAVRKVQRIQALAKGLFACVVVAFVLALPLTLCAQDINCVSSNGAGAFVLNVYQTCNGSICCDESQSVGIWTNGAWTGSGWSGYSTRAITQVGGSRSGNQGAQLTVGAGSWTVAMWNSSSLGNVSTPQVFNVTAEAGHLLTVNVSGVAYDSSPCNTCWASLTFSFLVNGGAVSNLVSVSPCAAPCTSGMHTNSVVASGQIFNYPFNGKFVTAQITAWVTRSNCVSGAWVVETNTQWQVQPNSYLVLTACPDTGVWQTRQQITGYSLVGNQMQVILGSVQANLQSCADILLQKSGLSTNGMTAAQISQLMASVASGQFVINPGAGYDLSSLGLTNGGWGYGSTSNQFGIESNGVGVSALLLSSNGGVVSASDGSVIRGAASNGVVNALGGSLVNIGNLADVAAAVAQGVRDGMAGLSNGAAGSPDGTGADLGGLTNATDVTIQTGWVGSVSSMIGTAQVSSTLNGASSFAGIGRLHTYTLGPWHMAEGTAFQKDFNLVIDFDSGIGVGISLFRTALLVGLVVTYWVATMRTIREGIA